MTCYNNRMLPLSLVTWWYGTGWRDQAELCGSRLSRVSDRFSVGLLLRSLFSPFRQISAEDATGRSIDVQVRAWLDNLISRCIGAMVRSAIILVGVLWLSVEAVVAVSRLILWPLLPVLPLIGFVLMTSGWIPWQI